MLCPIGSEGQTAANPRRVRSPGDQWGRGVGPIAGSPTDLCTPQRHTLAPNMAAIADDDERGVAHRGVSMETALSGPGGACMGSWSLFFEMRSKSVRGHRPLRLGTPQRQGHASHQVGAVSTGWWPA